MLPFDTEGLASVQEAASVRSHRACPYVITTDLHMHVGNKIGADEGFSASGQSSGLSIGIVWIDVDSTRKLVRIFALHVRCKGLARVPDQC